MRMLTPLSSMDIGPRLTASGTWFAILFLLLVPRSMPAQGDAPLRVVTVTAGVGNAMGWYGAQGERYFGPDRLSAFVGAGYTPSLDHTSHPALPSPQASAATPRGSGTAGSWRPRSASFHREQCVRARSPTLRPRPRRGNQYAARGGFTLMTSLGLGYAPGVEDGYTKVGVLVNLGLGYTWRRRTR